MKYGINTLDDIPLKGKTVLLRLDINQPVDKESETLKDITRIRATIPTLIELHAKGAKVVILAHQGSDIEYHNFYTTKPHAKVLSELLNMQVKFIEDVCGPAALEEIKNLQDGEILLLDNVRFISEEQTLFEKNLKLSHEEQAQTLLVRKLAPLADFYICDAFAAAHRDQPSLCGFQQVLPSVMGRLFEDEYGLLSRMMEKPERDCVFILGGAKIADAFSMMNTVLENESADFILTGGVVANILLGADGVDIGKTSLHFIQKQGYEKFIESGKELIEKYKDKIILPTDLAYVVNGKRIEASIHQLPNEFGLVDIGENTISIYKDMINNAQTIFVNGPMGIFEKNETELGTKQIWKALSETKGFTVIGGGDSISATNKYHLQEGMNYICTGGGALIRFLSGEELPVVTALKKSAELFKTEFHVVEFKIGLK
ncbi:phosphoglycerate kinase [Bacillus sp. B15-48]|uniref:phosphoglycerate kinase n=1 Tax=Bacillus sp. B15-48 TaxID=1548601 RepID=UPI00193FE8A1|nr:phosphoglycerate kinase [Bacillus sp. B15-48]MBM4761200.1 phosphoglycerate kinase [Bacillus sp. B15-48]